MCALRADRRRSSRGPFCALPLLSSVCSGQALALFPSHNCQPTQSFVLRAMYKVSRSFPRTPGVCPSFSSHPSFTTLLSSSLSLLFYGAHHPCFADSFFFLGEAAHLTVSPRLRLLPCRAAYSFRPCDRPARLYTG